MKVALVTDVVLADWIGGGTLVNDYLLNRITAAGHSVNYLCINPTKNDWDIANHDDIDIYLVTNIPHMSGSQLVQLISGTKPYVIFRHDIASICYSDDPRKHPAALTVQMLFEHSRANIFISNIQLAYYQRICEIKDVLVLPPPLDLDAFIDQNRADRSGHLYIGEISAQRGIEETILEMTNESDSGPHDFYGQVSDPHLLAKIERSGGARYPEIPHGEIPNLLNSYRHFYYYPRIIDAFCLKVLEAELCGMTMHVNRTNIGRYYYDANARQLADFMKNESVEMILQLIR